MIYGEAQCAAFLLEKGEIREKATEKEFKKGSKEGLEKVVSENAEDSSNKVIEKTFKKIFKETCHKAFYENVKKTSLDPLRRSGQECQYDAIY